ncbi:phytanoyl-CoA dioxygenase family protein [Roseateles sp.]|uniref:phytanoyl-CoA dioxygenase family protein n=1 Tax=Roseateles sp. TaxID=1971397 RepID=UPI0031D6CF4A
MASSEWLDTASVFDARGFITIPGLLPAAGLASLAPVLLCDGAVGGSRCLLARAEIAALAVQLAAHPEVRALVSAEHVAVQCTYFEKSTDRNWLVPIHQDLSIPVARRVESERLRGWSEKEGSIFVQPPVEVLEQLLAVRLHLDDCGEDDGPLRLVAGSHRLGIVGPERAIAERGARGETTCAARAGDALVMRPLALHASSKSSGTSRRRVLHFLYGPPTLPEGLDWAVGIRLDAGTHSAEK